MKMIGKHMKMIGKWLETIVLSYEVTSFPLQAELAALPASPRDVVGDIRVTRFLRYHGGRVKEAPGPGMVFQEDEEIWGTFYSNN